MNTGVIKGILLLLIVGFPVGRAEVYAEENQACIAIFACDEKTGDLLPEIAGDPESPCYQNFLEQCDAYKGFLAERRAREAEERAMRCESDREDLLQEIERLQRKLKRKKRKRR